MNMEKDQVFPPGLNEELGTGDETRAALHNYVFSVL